MESYTNTPWKAHSLWRQRESKGKKIRKDHSRVHSNHYKRNSMKCVRLIFKNYSIQNNVVFHILRDLQKIVTFNSVISMKVFSIVSHVP